MEEAHTIEAKNYAKCIQTTMSFRLHSMPITLPTSTILPETKIKNL